VRREPTDKSRSASESVEASIGWNSIRKIGLVIDTPRDHYSVASAAGQTVAHPTKPELRTNLHLVQRSAGST
jgi:hypothetical protein